MKTLIKNQKDAKNQNTIKEMKNTFDAVTSTLSHTHNWNMRKRRNTEKRRNI